MERFGKRFFELLPKKSETEDEEVRNFFSSLFGLLLIPAVLFGIPYFISLGWHAGATLR